MRVLFSVAEPVPDQRNPSEKGGRARSRGENQHLDQLWSDHPNPQNHKHKTFTSCPSFYSFGLSQLALGLPVTAPCLSLPEPCAHFLARSEFPGSVLPSETPPTPRSRRRALPAWGRRSLTPPRPLSPGLLTPLLIAVLTCRIDWRPLWMRLRGLGLGAAAQPRAEGGGGGAGYGS